MNLHTFWIIFAALLAWQFFGESLDPVVVLSRG